jgi:Phage tail protein (Tail_P2_I)
MISSNSTWDRKSAKKLKSPAFVFGSARVYLEFENRFTSKIGNYRLGNVTFRKNLADDLESGRNEQITLNYENSTADGYRYKSVSHVHIPDTLLGPELEIFAHGSPGKNGFENCAIIRASCVDGTDKQCLAGKCKIGALSRVEGDKWRYDSFTVPGLHYYVYGSEYVDLRSIVRGKFVLPAGSGTVNVDRVASIPARVYLPPSTYESETFTRRVIVRLSDEGNIKSVTDSVDDFLRRLLYRSQATVEAEEQIYDKLVDTIKSTLDPVWHGVVTNGIEEVWIDRGSQNNRDFLISCYYKLSEIYESGIQTALSRIKGSSIQIDEQIGRPVYGRLPGVEEAYNKEDDSVAVAKWLISGTDDFLSSSKTLLDNFYLLYLNPDTCYPPNLDWIAQHVGFTSNLWNSSWPDRVKRLLITNAHVNKLSGSMWTTDPEADTFRKIDLGFIEQYLYNPVSGISTFYRYTSKVYDTETDLTGLVRFSNLVVDASAWTGLLPARGSMLSLMFMLWVFGIKAHSAEEFQGEPLNLTVRSGLRELEITSPINTPYMVDMLKVGTDTDAEVNNFANQMIADMCTCQDELSANTVVVRMPFYYNRNGRTWDAAQHIVENYAPVTCVTRLQYAISTADLSVADDVFFEPSIEPV